MSTIESLKECYKIKTNLKKQDEIAESITNFLRLLSEEEVEVIKPYISCTNSNLVEIKVPNHRIIYAEKSDYGQFCKFYVKSRLPILSLAKTDKRYDFLAEALVKAEK